MLRTVDRGFIPTIRLLSPAAALFAIALFPTAAFAKVSVDADGCVETHERGIREATEEALRRHGATDLVVDVHGTGIDLALRATRGDGSVVLTRSWTLANSDCESAPLLVATVIDRFLDGFPRDTFAAPAPALAPASTPLDWPAPPPPTEGARMSARPYLAGAATFLPSAAEPLLAAGGEIEAGAFAERGRDGSPTSMTIGLAGRAGSAGDHRETAALVGFGITHRGATTIRALVRGGIVRGEGRGITTADLGWLEAAVAWERVVATGGAGVFAAFSPPRHLHGANGPEDLASARIGVLVRFGGAR